MAKRKKKKNLDRVAGEVASKFRRQHSFVETLALDASLQDSTHKSVDIVKPGRQDPLNYYLWKRHSITSEQREAALLLRSRFQSHREARVVSGGYAEIGSGSVQNARVSDIDWRDNMNNAMLSVPAAARPIVTRVVFEERRVETEFEVILRRGLQALVEHFQNNK